MAPEAQRAKGGDALPDAAQNGRRVAVERRSGLRHYSVAPAANPSVPSIAVPPPKIPALVKKLMEPERIVLNGLSIKDPTYPASPTPPMTIPNPVTPVANVVRKASRPGMPKPPAAAVLTPKTPAVMASGNPARTHVRIDLCIRVSFLCVHAVRDSVAQRVLPSILTMHGPSLPP